MTLSLHDIHREKVAHIRHVFLDTSIEKVASTTAPQQYAIPIEAGIAIIPFFLSVANSCTDGHPEGSHDPSSPPRISTASPVSVLTARSEDLPSRPSCRSSPSTSPSGSRYSRRSRRPTSARAPCWILPTPRTVDAFVLMAEHGFSAVGFLASHNRVFGNLSVKDAGPPQGV